MHIDSMRRYQCRHWADLIIHDTAVSIILNQNHVLSAYNVADCSASFQRHVNPCRIGTGGREINSFYVNLSASLLRGSKSIKAVFDRYVIGLDVKVKRSLNRLTNINEIC